MSIIDRDACWWREHPAILVREDRAIRALEKESWLTNVRPVVGSDPLLRWLGTVTVYFQPFHFELIYPSDFPAGCPVLFPQDRSNGWSIHQWQDGTLCTEYGPDTWDSQFTAANVISSLHRLLMSEKIPTKGFRPRKVVASRHVMNNTTHHFANFGVILYPPDWFRQTAETGGVIKGHILPSAKNMRFLISSRIDETETKTIEIHKSLVPQDSEIPGLWFRVDGNDAVLNGLASVSKLAEAISATSKGKQDLKTKLLEMAEATKESPIPILTVDKTGTPAKGYLYLPKTEDVFPLDSAEYSPQRIGDRRTIGHNDRSLISSKTVGIIGLGSLGGRIAVSLCRLGIQNFVLVDPEILLWENLSRHEGTAHDIGRLKTDIIAERIRSYNPTASIREFKLTVGRVESPGCYQEVYEALSNCSLVLDCTATTRVAHLVTQLCYQKQIPSIHMEVFARGLGSQIVRVVPTETACYQCQARVLASYFSEQPPAPDVHATSYDGDPMGPHFSVTADDDVCTLTAGFVVKVAKDCLLRKCGEPTSVPGHIYLLGFEQEWIFQEPFEVRKISSLSPQPHCPICSGDEAIRHTLQMTSEEVEQEVKKVEARIEYVGGTDSSTSTG